MVAHNVSDVSLSLAVMVRRRPFFQEDLLIMFLTLVLNVLPIDKVEVEPRFVVAALEKAPWSRTFQCLSDSGGSRNPHTSAQLPGIDPGLHNVVEPGSDGKAQSAKASSMVLMLFLLLQRHAAPLKSPATRSTFSSSVTALIVRMSFFPIPRFLT